MVKQIVNGKKEKEADFVTVEELQKKFPIKGKMSHYTIIAKFLQQNIGRAYQVRKIQEALNMKSDGDYWSIMYACKFLIADGRVDSHGSNPVFYSWKAE